VKLAIAGGTPVFSPPFSPPWPMFDEREKRYVLEAIEARGWGGFPEPMPLAAKFAERFAKAHDSKYGVCCVNGSVTLEIALAALGIKAGDEVIVPTYTWIATGAAPIHMNAVPVIVDIEPDTYCIDPKAVEAAITPRTVGIIPVHLGCGIADLDALKAIAGKHKLWIVEDCAHAHGSAWKGRAAGSWGELGSFSFQTSKLMTSGEGGALVTSSDELANKVHSLTNCGRKVAPWDRFEGQRLGVNGRLSELQAAVLLAQLERLEEQTQKRQGAADSLERELTKLGLTPLKKDPRVTRRAHYQLIMRYDPRAFGGLSRTRLLKALMAEGIEIDGGFYVPMPDNPAFDAQSAHWPMLRERYGDGTRAPATLARQNTPVAHQAAYDEAIWIDHTYLLSGPENLARIVEAFAKVKEHAAQVPA
jgi:dTDP-4-amino-4,6-dideoxygalactose transaminase